MGFRVCHLLNNLSSAEDLEAFTEQLTGLPGKPKGRPPATLTPVVLP